MHLINDCSTAGTCYDVGAASSCDYDGDLKVAATFNSFVAEDFSPPFTVSVINSNFEY
ncbi:hypothetical protein MYX76_02950 [Desulfobacterota bacterium AH_259_B03_O07]|nr:hypothetical protein [Desulfobacterota bacterium AH_259_B03_O07]